jgi:hypothetical protein
MKLRLVFAVPGEIAICQSFLDLIAKSVVSKSISAPVASGLTQPLISRRVSQFKHKQSVSLDASKFDLTIGPYAIMLWFTLIKRCFFPTC